MNERARRYLFIGLPAALVLLLFLCSRLTGLLVNALWFDQLGYLAVFLRLLLLKFALGTGAGLVALLFFGFNLHLALRRALAGDQHGGNGDIQLWPDTERRLSPALLRWGAWLLAVPVAALFLSYFAEQWDLALRYFWHQPMRQVDPVYGRDLGFYLFRLPFLELVQNGATLLAFLTFAAVLAPTLLAARNRRGQGMARPSRPASRHLAILLLLFLAGYAWGFYLDRFELLYSASGVVYGAGFTELHVVRIGLWIMLAASVILGVILLVGAWRNRLRFTLWGTASYLLLLVTVLLLIPWGVQTFIVEPNELELEQPYLENEIAFTRRAYAIDRAEVDAYPALTDLTWAKVNENEQTLRNVRLWDWRPLRQTFRQLQEIRLYYQFYEVDVDRYRLDGDYRQVMLSARELAPTLPERADTWVNRTLQFTHGYGLVMSLASQEGAEGTPTFLIRDLPPKTAGGLTLAKPAVFYGEKMPGYRIVNTGAKELDYPKGDKNVYTSYAGKGGIPIDSWWKKLLFAWELRDVNILLSGYLTDDSRLQLRRRVQERIGSLTPFLHLDPDPYLVLSDGRLYWIQDLYTTSDRYPYAEPYRHDLNYIRNAAKAVVDVYQGTVRYYVMQPDEPVLQAYRQAFPQLLRPLSDMPADLQRHLRYPEGLFRIQVDKYSRYHMTIPQVFYNNEDLWTLPQEKYAGEPIPMEPYYILMRLPGKARLEFLLMQPLTPQNRNNMIGWMAGRCDQPNYGRLLVYKLPKEKLILGPMQVEAIIDQDPVISRQLSLWDQRGSQVIRGNLLVIPLDHSFLYVEPVYLTAEGNNIPQLQRVIVVYNERVAMQPTLKRAVAALFGHTAETPAATATAPRPTQGLEDARASFERAQKALQQGDWQGFGRAMDELQQQLHEPGRER